MSLKLGNNDVTKVMLGSQELSSIYKGADEVWSVGGGGNALSDVFSTYLYEGTGAAEDIVNGIDLAGGVGMVWIKRRDGTYSHVIHDTERGPGNYVNSDATAGAKDNAEYLKSFTSTGFGVGSASEVNQKTASYVSWTWRMGPKFFDAVVYSGGQGEGAQIPHNLGCKPGMFFVKKVSNSASWQVYHSGMGAGYSGNLNKANAFASNATWSYTEPTETHFVLGTSSNVNGADEQYIAYLFAHDDSDDSIIKCGSYEGNGNADGPEVDVGFEPQWLLFKNATKSEAWTIFDTARGITNGGNDEYLMPDNNGVGVSQPCLDLTPTGFKITRSSDFLNELNGKIIYMAIKADPDFFMPPEWEQMNQDVAEKLAKREAVKEAIVSKVKDSKDIKDDS